MHTSLPSQACVELTHVLGAPLPGRGSPCCAGEIYIAGHGSTCSVDMADSTLCVESFTPQSWYGTYSIPQQTAAADSVCYAVPRLLVAGLLCLALGSTKLNFRCHHGPAVHSPTIDGSWAVLWVVLMPGHVCCCWDSTVLAPVLFPASVWGRQTGCCTGRI
jgi:hypothetical protein